ncbi:11405_t:CDS:10, partial [Scutellospora calospora]
MDLINKDSKINEDLDNIQQINCEILSLERPDFHISNCSLDPSRSTESVNSLQPLTQTQSDPLTYASVSPREPVASRVSTPSRVAKSQISIPFQQETLSPFENDDTSSRGMTFSDSEDISDTKDGRVEKIIMAVNLRNRKLGCAYYNFTTSKLYLMEDVAESPPYDMVNLLRFQVSPSIILVSSRADDAFIQALQAEDGSIPIPSTVEIRPGSEFIYASAKTKLFSIRLGDQKHVSSHADTNKQEIYLHLSSIVNVESIETVCCAGALISYISRAKITGILSEDQQVGKQISTYQCRYVKSHPNMHMQAKAKEGLSLFGILNNTRTVLGKYLLKQWFLRPTLDLTILDERHRTIECFLQPDNLDISGQFTTCLRHIKNIPKIIENMNGRLNIKDWQSLLQIRETFIISDLKDIGSYINDVIDFDESVKESRIVVKPHVDEELDHMKRTYDGLDDFLFEVAREISTSIPTEFASTLNVIYFPQLGYLVTVPLKPEWRDEEDFKIDGLYYQFSTATTVYYKNDRMRELDEYLGDIHGLIVDREIEIMQKLQDRVLEYVPLFLSSSAVCAELDCLLSFAESARRYGYNRPIVTDENILIIEKGRHPLQELCVNVFVANDTKLVGGRGVLDEDDKMYEDSLTSENDTYNSVMLLSGANYSGKSVYLKQVALITYMTHIGSFVPAESATIGLTDKIFTRIQTKETIQSAFMIDLQQISIALRNSTSRSLLIFDEFGKGTGSTGRDCPKVIAATHFHEIFENNLLSQSLPISLTTMEIMNDDEDEELTFLYRLIPGRSTSSWGTFCATLAGVSPHIVKRAIHLSHLFSRYESIPPPFVDDRERRLYATCEQVARKFLELDLEKTDTDVNCFLEW